MNEKIQNSNNKFLIAVDESESSLKAVSYVGEMLKNMKDFHIFILHILNEPEKDFFPTAQEKDQWLNDQKQTFDHLLRRYHDLLVEKGIDPEKITSHDKIRYCPSIAECILNERESTGCGTIIVGRKGVSHKEEFLFGSVSNKIIHQARHCTIWVVE